MGNLFIALPAPAANGSGAAVDVSAFGALKTFTASNLISSRESAHVTIEVSNQAVPTHWAPVYTFLGPNDQTLSIAARWMRATVGNYQGAGAPVVRLSGNDDGTVSADLSSGATVDTSTMPELKTVTVGGAFDGSLQIEISGDGGTTWASVMSFQNPGQQSLSFTASAMRVRNPSGAPIPAVFVTATVPGGGGSGGGTSASGDRGWYGTGVDGDFESDGDYDQERDEYRGNILIRTGDTFHTNGFKLHWTGTLTIEEGGFLDNSGVTVTGAPAGTLLGGGNGAGPNVVDGELGGVAGDSVAWWPLASAGGNGGAGGGCPDPIAPLTPQVGGAGGVANRGLGSGPYAIETIASGDGVCGGAGGGSGAVASNTSATGGPGGGGGGVMVLRGRYFNPDNPDNAIRVVGGPGGAGVLTGINQQAGGGGGGAGGTINIVTDDPVPPVCNVSGGPGGAGAGGGENGVNGEDGAVNAISPIWGPI